MWNSVPARRPRLVCAKTLRRNRRTFPALRSAGRARRSPFSAAGSAECWQPSRGPRNPYRRRARKAARCVLPARERPLRRRLPAFVPAVARPERISSSRGALIFASRNSVEGISRECDLACLARGPKGSQRFAVQFQLKRSRVLGGHLEVVLLPNRSGFRRP